MNFPDTQPTIYDAITRKRNSRLALMKRRKENTIRVVFRGKFCANQTKEASKLYVYIYTC